MEDKPLTEQDFFIIKDYSGHIHGIVTEKEKVQSAKKMLKSYLCTDCWKWIDACFQIPDSDGKKGDDE
jgi:hypothetical protein